MSSVAECISRAHWWQSIDWGTVPAWVMAIGAVGTLYSIRLQAKKWVSEGRAAIDTNAHKVFAVHETGDGQKPSKVMITNGGEEPIFSVRAILSRSASDGTVTEALPQSIAVIPPEETVSQHHPLSGARYTNLVSLSFTDSRGKHWRRQWRDNVNTWGKLEQIEQSSAGIVVSSDPGRPALQGHESPSVDY